MKQVEEAYESIEARTSVFAKFDYVVQGMTILTQLFLTGLIATRLGVTALLTIIPAVMVVGFSVSQRSAACGRSRSRW